ncbi:DgyrCDS6744 [Dimorphilus gyrociliatus]|uniref:DgyrCDS6744 n=1 Tax=Dimorphilus gyrociliatus TaxID=2664684 RepID=A0A7I8VRM5_9ANNE|nr:DgyrCDS6744 [Dimorphilus gyrociliatus]
MAAKKIPDEECLLKGTKLLLRCVDGREKRGEVMAFDPTNEILILRRRAKSGKRKLYDIDMINMQHIQELKVTEEPRNDFEVAINFVGKEELAKRTQNNVEMKKNESRYIGFNVPPKAQNLCNFIRQTIEEVSWQEKSLVVFDEIVISPPYGTENVDKLAKLTSSKPNDHHALSHVRKIVEKFHRTRTQDDQ